MSKEISVHTVPDTVLIELTHYRQVDERLRIAMIDVFNADMNLEHQIANACDDGEDFDYDELCKWVSEQLGHWLMTGLRS